MNMNKAVLEETKIKKLIHLFAVSIFLKDDAMFFISI